VVLELVVTWRLSLAGGETSASGSTCHHSHTIPIGWAVFLVFVGAAVLIVVVVVVIQCCVRLHRRSVSYYATTNLLWNVYLPTACCFWTIQSRIKVHKANRKPMVSYLTSFESNIVISSYSRYLTSNHHHIHLYRSNLTYTITRIKEK